MASFSATYRQLSQYLKEQQRQAATVTRPTTTMSLLPGLDVLPKTEADISDQQPMDLFPQHAGLGLAAPEQKSQLTIFYGGQILVFDDFPADKAKNLILMAGKSKSVIPSLWLEWEQLYRSLEGHLSIDSLRREVRANSSEAPKPALTIKSFR